jgi:hypothetical protein
MAHPALVGVVAALSGGVVLYLIEVWRWWRNPTRLPWGLGFFRWKSNWIGDLVLLPGTTATVAVYYQNASVEPSFFTSVEFFSICIFLAWLVPVYLIVHEERNDRYPKGHKINENRVYHFIYMWWMAFLIIPASRAWFYGQETWTVVAASLFFAGHAVTFILDGLDIRPLWYAIEKRYPRERTEIP